MMTRTLQCLGPHGFHTLNYYEWGDAGNDDVVICAHGLTRNGRDFDHLAQALSARCRVLCPDIVGRGRSAWLPHKEDYGYQQYCADMAALIARSGARRISWVGTSMGGLIGMLLAAQAGSPIQCFVINDIGPFIPKASIERIAGYVGQAVSFADLESFERYIRAISAPFGKLTDAQWRHLAETNAKCLDDGTWTSIYDPGIALGMRHAAAADVDLWPYWDQVRCPTLLLRGAESDVLSLGTALEMGKRGPCAALVEFAAVGHAPALMDSQQVAVVKDFLLQ